MEKTIHLLIMYTMLVLSVLLFHIGRKQFRSLILGLYALVEAITNGMVSLSIWGGNEFFDHYPLLHFIYKPLYCLWVPLFYLYVKSTLAPHFRWTKKQLIHFAPFGFYVLLFVFVIALKGRSFIWENLYFRGTFVYLADYSIDIVIKLQYILYNAILIFALSKIEGSQKADSAKKNVLPISIHWIRFMVYGYSIASAIAILNFVLFTVNYKVNEGVNMLSISCFFFFFFALFYHTITHRPFELNNSKLQKAPPDDSMRTLMKRIHSYVIIDQKFLDPELTLQKLAEDLKEKDRDISKAINTIENRNFKDYLTAYRIEHACKLLLEDVDKPIFEVMFDSGFNTKGAFNLAFKKTTQLTPSAYRKINSK